MYSLFSLGAGFLSWGLGAAALCRRDWSILPVSSLSLCILSLVSQFLEINRRVDLEDWAAIEDTFPGVLVAAVVLTCVTLALNAAALLRRKEKPSL